MNTEQYDRRFVEYCQAKEVSAVAAALCPYTTVRVAPLASTMCSIGNAWTEALYDGPFFRSLSATLDNLPSVSVVFVQSRSGNTGADDPSVLGGGETDKHLIYEGLSRVDADAVMAGATTANSPDLVFSVWHPQLVSLRLARGRSRHPAQAIVCSRTMLPIEDGLMFGQPAVQVFLITASHAAAALRSQVAMRPWIEVIDAGEPLSMRQALGALAVRGIRTISCVGGRRTASALIDQGLVQDLYLTTSAIDGGAPNTPLLEEPRTLDEVIVKAGTGAEEGVRFVHYRLPVEDAVR